ncbi:ABC transporter permease subunit [Rhizobium leguminosarum bv. viciae]|nr:ABC transporter permease subunit [Rhizobium leguminosarum bv. viciae]NKL56906.1 ABC transporter permease subunit [Rhizobium leguminosarum bv. viciae]
MLTPTAPYKMANAIYLLVVFPLVAFVLLTGGNYNVLPGSYAGVICLAFWIAATLPLSVFGVDEGAKRNSLGLALAGAAVILWGSSFIARTDITVFGISFDSGFLSLASGCVSLWVVLSNSVARRSKAFLIWALALATMLAAMLLLDIDFGLVPVETAQWGGLTVTLVVSITGIAASLPLGILLALGRQSNLPAIRTMSIVFIEFVRGVPLITVLFMASVMLPLFLPPGMNFDKLLRALVGVALFSAAYMAEVVRGGLQAVPKGQYEGATALGLSYWQMMAKIILPQALKISIPNIVGNFIVLFKDTTLVLIIGLFDLLAMAQTGLRDAAWATPVTAPTGYLAIALIYWAFCFSMSRYAIFTERRLHTGHKR